MKPIPHFRFQFSPLRLLAISLALSLFGAANSQAANILFVINSFSDPTTPALGNDQEVLDRLTGKGHKVTLADDDTVGEKDTAGIDLVLISSSVNSGAAGLNPLCKNVLQTGRIPVINYEPALGDELLLQILGTYGNAAGHTSLGIVGANKSHPLAAGKSGIIDIVGPGDSAVVSSSALPLSLGKEAILIATNATPGVDEGRVAMWAYEKGSHLADNTTVVPSRRVEIFYNASTAPAVYNDNATALFDAAIKWALEAPANLPITAVLRSPASLNAAPDSSILLELEDGSTSIVNGASISLLLNGTALTPKIGKSGKITTASVSANGFFPAGSSNGISVVYSDSGAPAQKFTNNFQFIVENYITLTPSMKVAAPAIDRTKTGFTIKLRQMDVARPGGSTLATVRDQLNDKLIDPGTGQPFPDLIDRSQTGFEPGSGFKPDGTFTETGVINYNQDALGVGAEMGVFVGPAVPDKPIPGIPGTSAITDYIALQARTVLDLKAGVYRFGVNSDDGFGVTAGPNPQDAFALLAGAFNADRGQGTTEFSVAVAEDGLYPIELIYWETGGGAEVEFFSTDRTSGQRILINDKANANSIKGFQPPAASASLATVTSVKPQPGAVSVPKNTSLTITIADGASPIASSSIKLTLDGAAISPTVSKAGAVTTITYKPASDLQALSTHTVGLQFSDSATPPNARSESYSFVVESVLPKALFLSGALTASDNLIISRLKSLGFEVVAVLDTASQTSDADGKNLIVISSTVGSGNIGTKYTALPVPIIDWEPALYDELGIELNNANGITVTAQTDVEIKDASHPLAAGLTAGVKTIMKAASDMASLNDIVPSAKIIAISTDGSNHPMLFALEKGDALNGSATVAAAPARRVGFPLSNDSFINANPDGLKLFDAAVKWAANLGEAPPKFNPPSVQGGNMNLAWTGTGRLQQADSVVGPWTDSPNQNNPQTVSVASGSKFYRIRQ